LLAFHDRHLISQSGSEAPRLFDEKLAGLEPIYIYKGYDSNIGYAPVKALSSNGMQVHVEINGEKSWLQGPHESWPLLHTGVSSAWTFSPDSHWLATVSNSHRLTVWHVDASGMPSLTIPPSSQHASSGQITALAFSSDGHWLASGDAAGESRLWNLVAPDSDPTALVNHRGKVNALAFSKDGDLIATAGEDGIVRISKIADNQAPRTLPNSPGDRGEPITALAFLSNDRLAMAGSSNRILLWKYGQEVVLESTGFGIKEFVSSPRGTHLAGLTSKGAVQIWYSMDDGNLISRPVVISDLYNIPINLVSFMADGNGLKTSTNGILRRWELRTKKLLETACRAAGRNLTEREWKEYILSEPYQEREPCPEFPKAYD
jgi:WD40 repeat protein